MTRVKTWEGVEYLVVTKVFCRIGLRAALASAGALRSGQLQNPDMRTSSPQWRGAGLTGVQPEACLGSSSAGQPPTTNQQYPS